MPVAGSPIRLLTAVPICDGHDSAINTINLELIEHGMEVIYLGYNRSARDIVRGAIQEDVRAIGISTYNGGHVEFFGEVIDLLRRHGAGEIGVFGGGGGTINRADARAMLRKGVDRIFFAGTPLEEVSQFIQTKYARPKVKNSGRADDPDRRLARLLTTIESGRGQISHRSNRKQSARVIGVTGPGGAGKTTLIDELVLRCLQTNPTGRIAILSHDPSIVGKGALLGDRATMIYSQNDRVFMRSLATRGHSGGLSRQSRRCLDLLRADFDVVFVETVGIGQESSPFSGAHLDQTVYVMSPDYGGRLQLQKIVMLDVADVIVVNKFDLPGAKTAQAEVAGRLGSSAAHRPLVATTAGKHRDSGVDDLFCALKLDGSKS